MLLDSGSSLRAIRHRGIGGDIDPNVNVWRAAEMPDERRPFQPPIVPHTVLTDIAVRVEDEAALVEAALFLEALAHFALVLGAKGLQQELQNLLQFLLLVGGQFGDGNTGQLAIFATKTDGRLENFVKERYGSWDSGIGKEIESGQATFESLDTYMLEKGAVTPNASGRQEYLENLINEFI